MVMWRTTAAAFARTGLRGESAGLLACAWSYKLNTGKVQLDPGGLFGDRARCWHRSFEDGRIIIPVSGNSGGRSHANGKNGTSLYFERQIHLIHP